MKRLTWILVYFLFFVWTSPAFALQLFPGAEGYGTAWSIKDWSDVTPDIYFINDLNPNTGRVDVCGARGITCTGFTAYTSGFLTAVGESGPRVVIFETSGVISLGGVTTIGDGEVMILGATAPSPGVNLHGGGLNLCDNASKEELLFQHLRIRMGFNGTTTGDGLSITGNSDYFCRKMVIDHVSIAWTRDGSIDLQTNTGTTSTIDDITISNSFIVEPLSAHAFPMLNGNNAETGSANVSYIRNLIAHYEFRGPRTMNGNSVLIVNDLNYDGDSMFIDFSGTKGDGPLYAGIYGNVTIAGPIDPALTDSVEIASNVDAGSEIYYNDLLCDAGTNGACVDDNTAGGVIVGTHPTEMPLPSPLTIRATAGDVARDYVLDKSGAFPLARDAVDTRVVAEVLAGTGGYVADEDDVGGFPAIDVNPVVHTDDPTFPLSNAYATAPSGYTNLEDWAHVKLAIVNGDTEDATRPTLSSATFQSFGGF